MSGVIGRTFLICGCVIVAIFVGLSCLPLADGFGNTPPADPSWFVYFGLVQSIVVLLPLGWVWLKVWLKRRAAARLEADPYLAELAAGAAAANASPASTNPPSAPPARLAPLTCPQCGASVPLSGTELSCPACGARVEAPVGLADTLRVREDTQRELERAARVVRIVHMYSTATLARAAEWFVWCSMFFTIAAGAYCFAVDAPWLYLAPVITVGGITMAFATYVLASYLATTRAMIPALPALGRLPAEPVACLHCGAPISFDAGCLAAVCPYCGAGQVRLAMAHAVAEANAADAAAVVSKIADKVAKDRAEAVEDVTAGALVGCLITGLIVALVFSGRVGPTR